MTKTKKIQNIERGCWMMLGEKKITETISKYRNRIDAMKLELAVASSLHENELK